MITEDYVSYEVAKLLKEKGFNEICSYEWGVPDIDEGYILQKWSIYNGEIRNSELIDDAYAAPTHQMVCKWLREEHKIFIYIEPFITTSGLQGYKPYCTKIGGEFMWINPLRKHSNTSSDTYEEAVEAAIKYTLENLI